MIAAVAATKLRANSVNENFKCAVKKKLSGEKKLPFKNHSGMVAITSANLILILKACCKIKFSRNLR